MLASVFTIVACINGCDSNQADTLVKEQIQAMNDLSEVLETKAPASEVAEIQ